MSKPAADSEATALNVTLAGRPYPLRVTPEDEPAIRRISKELNDRVVEFQRSYVGKDKQDCLAMLLLIYAVDLYKVKGGRDVGTPVAGALPPDALATIEQLSAEVATALEESAAEEDEDTAAG